MAATGLLPACRRLQEAVVDQCGKENRIKLLSCMLGGAAQGAGPPQDAGASTSRPHGCL